MGEAESPELRTAYCASLDIKGRYTRRKNEMREVREWRKSIQRKL